MKPEFKISVIIPVYNAGKYFDKCISSIVNQTYKNLEIIIINDGSTDETPKKCDKWAELDERIKVIHKPNGGVSSARNAGLDNATGDYIGFVDADDYLDNNMYEIMMNDIIDTQANAAGCSIVRENEHGLKEFWGEENAPLHLKSRNDILISICSTLELVCIHVGTKLFSKEVIGDIRFYTTFRYCEDILFNYQVALNIDNMACRLLPSYHFVYNSDSATQNRVEANKFDEIKVQDIIISLSPNELLPYCYKGDVLKSINKLKEILTDNVCSREDFQMLRKRVALHKTEIIKSGLYSKATKIKALMFIAFPSIFKLIYKAYGKRQAARYKGKMG